jgi:nicotinamide riboside transporter PnuC
MKELFFALSLIPYLLFLWYAHRSQRLPRLALAGFAFTLVFVAATIPAGIYALQHYGTTLANVDWLHGAAESLLTIANILVVVGFASSGDSQNSKSL